MSLRGRPSLSGTPGRSSLQPSSPKVDLAQLRLLLLSARDLPCFQVSFSRVATIRNLVLSRAWHLSFCESLLDRHWLLLAFG